MNNTETKIRPRKVDIDPRFNPMIEEYRAGFFRMKFSDAVNNILAMGGEKLREAKPQTTPAYPA